MKKHSWCNWSWAQYSPAMCVKSFNGCWQTESDVNPHWAYALTSHGMRELFVCSYLKRKALNSTQKGKNNFDRFMKTTKCGCKTLHINRRDVVKVLFPKYAFKIDLLENASSGT